MHRMPAGCRGAAHRIVGNNRMPQNCIRQRWRVKAASEQGGLFRVGGSAFGGQLVLKTPNRKVTYPNKRQGTRYRLPFRYMHLQWLCHILKSI